MCVSVSSRFKQKICMWFGPVKEVTYVHVLGRSTSTIVVKEPVISSEPTIVTGTTRDRPGKREFFLLVVFFSAKIRGSPCEGVRGLFYSARDLPLHGNIQSIRMSPSFTGD